MAARQTLFSPLLIYLEQGSVFLYNARLVSPVMPSNRHSYTVLAAACALCITAMHQNRTVKYIRANTLLKESDHARQEGTYFEYSNEMAAYDLMVIDDFGLMDLDIEKCRDLFEIIESRDCRKATIIISQIPVSGWYQLFGDSTYADACLSRMTSKAYRLEFPGRDRRITNSN